MRSQYLPFDPQWKAWGRVISKSVQGPNLLLELSNHSQWKVVYIEEYDTLQIGDWVALTEGQKILRVTPSLRSPVSSPAQEDILKKWMHYLSSIRQFFSEQEFLELQTPSLVRNPGTEPSLDPFETQLVINTKEQIRYLPTSPELHLKKALSMGYLKIFEIARCYRNGEITERHQPEFWMLEWYRGFSNLAAIQVDSVKLIQHLCRQFPTAIKPRKVISLTIPQAFKNILNVELTPNWTKQDYKNLCERLNLRVTDSFSIDDLFFLIMLEKIEPSFDPQVLTFVENYPPFQAALARKNSEGWAQRFEMYWQGMEISNAFDELNDPSEQRKRALEDLTQRAERQGKKFDGQTGLDDEFFQALESGLPPSSGIALGLDRLFMALFQISDIRSTRLFVTGT